MDLRKYGGHVGTSPTALDCRSRFTKAFFCSSFIPELWSRMAVNLRSSITVVSITKRTRCLKFSPRMTYTLSLTMSEAGKLIISETDMKGMN